MAGHLLVILEGETLHTLLTSCTAELFELVEFYLEDSLKMVVYW